MNPTCFGRRPFGQARSGVIDFERTVWGEESPDRHRVLPVPGGVAQSKVAKLREIKIHAC